MLRLSNFPFSTLKTRPKISDNISTSILLQGSYIRQAMAGAYEFLPMGYRVLKNIENIIREEMDLAGYHEMLFSILTPKELWETTDRWEIPEYFKVPGWGTTEYRIAPTAEENVTNIFKEYIQSYKDLPTCVYQIQKKFRNEKRAKSGLLRGREFVMKDAYSFHATIEDFEEFYKGVIKAYNKIFERLGIAKDTVMADADGGAISDKNSHEFQTFLDIGEDVIVMDSSGYCYNLELASGIADEKNISEKEEKLEIIDSVAEIVTMEKMADYFKAPLWKMLKTVVYKTDSGRYFSIILRGDLDVNELKVEKFIRKKFSEGFKQATEEDLQTLGTVRGFVTPLKNSNLKIINFADESLKSAKNYFGGANSLAKSSKNVNISDLDILEFGDFNEPIEGFTSKNIPNEKLVFKRASEVGNIFHLGNKYTKPFGITYLDENNKTVDNVEMGCYGIGVSRLMGVMAEYFMTENGIAWPENVAPYTHYIIVIGEENIEKAEKLAKELESEGKTVILDDRMGKKFGFGQKASDCELWGIPNRIVISPKTLDTGGYELTKRGQESEIIKF
ncbi:proline--tRNA ligase [Candidatus Gracilibacteria bacterium GN02-872]|nr:proline--tRNA ligase [Candidatus Gracilibacteria bacterium GN02-872]